jgi:chemotaxis protein methyltransferase CheR
MTTAIAGPDLERFRAAVATHTGMTFAADRSALLAEVLKQRMHSTDCADVDAYVGLLAPRAAEIAELAKLLTVGETYFLRNIEQFRVVEDYLGARQVGLDRRISMLSAGCSSGEEAYSFAILARERIPDVDQWNIAIRGIDLNPEALRKASQARYSPWSLRETPADIRERHFLREGSAFGLHANVRRMVEFERRNLVDPDPHFWRPDCFDIVFCRNVLMYLTADAAAGAVRRIAGSLRPGGLLFLGHAENLRGLSQEFRLRQSHGTFYYESRGDRRADQPNRRARSSLELPFAARSRAAGGANSNPADPSPAGDASWYDSIEKSAERIAALTTLLTPSDPPTGLSGTPTTARAVLASALELIGGERFADALATLEALPAAARDDPDGLLMQAMLLTCGGKPSAAEEVCKRLLGLDELNAGAHYVMALCREHAGDVVRAATHDETAIYLDPEFAMPRLHLGRLLRRRGNQLAARRELDEAVSLLAREDGARIVLFGGGFTRDGLIALCRAELQACTSVA